MPKRSRLAFSSDYQSGLLNDEIIVKLKIRDRVPPREILQNKFVLLKSLPLPYLAPAGNIGRVDFITENEYDLFVRPDTCNPRVR